MPDKGAGIMKRAKLLGQSFRGCVWLYFLPLIVVLGLTPIVSYFYISQYGVQNSLMAVTNFLQISIPVFSICWQVPEHGEGQTPGCGAGIPVVQRAYWNQYCRFVKIHDICFVGDDTLQVADSDLAVHIHVLCLCIPDPECGNGNHGGSGLLFYDCVLFPGQFFCIYQRVSVPWRYGDSAAEYC